jgi:deoxyadenosine/deoxycytidine kinase
LRNRRGDRRRIAQDALILQAEDPRHLLLERDGRRCRRRRRRNAARRREEETGDCRQERTTHRFLELKDDILAYTQRALDFRYIALEGPPGSGKSALAERLASRLDATAVLEDLDNPFLADVYSDRPGAAFQAQLFFVLSRHRQQVSLRQADLFAQVTISDYLFERDKIYAYLNLDDNELFIYQKLYEMLAADVPAPDIVVYLDAPVDVLARRLRGRPRQPDAPQVPGPALLQRLNEAYRHFFFHYEATPLLVVETSHHDFEHSDEAVDDLLRQLRTMSGGTRYYVSRALG